MRNVLVIAFLLAVSASFAAAQVPTSGNIFVGYSYYNTDLALNRGGLNGWEASLEGKVFPYVGIVADFSGDYGSLRFPIAVGTCAIGVVCSPPTSSAHLEHLLFGPRVSVPLGKVSPFAEAMFGFGHVHTDGFGSDTSFATALGGGLDYRILRPIAWRFEADYIRTHLFSSTQSNFRMSTGLVLRF